ncbi:MAG: phage virion morphogenesis protein [Candidatus Aenigmatarchaeota archaeon]
MSKVDIRIDDKEVLKLFKKLQQKMKDMTDVMRDISVIMDKDVKEHFLKEEGPEGKWEKLKYRKPSINILRLTGRHLWGTITPDYDKKSARVGTPTEWATIHQFGGYAGRGLKAKIPKRPFLWLSEQAKNWIKETMIEYLSNGV